MGSNCCKGDAAGRPIRSTSSIYSRYLKWLALTLATEVQGVPWVLRPLIPFTSRADASLDTRFTTSEDAGGVRLTVSAARTDDTGVYTLLASNGAGSAAARVRLEVSPDEAPTGEDPPTFLRRLQDLTVKVGTRTRFLVEIVSSTECKVTWYRNERRLLEAERVTLARDGHFWCADVATVSVDDAGRWTCTAENAGGRASCSAHLNVLVPKAYKRPEFVEELRALLTEQGTVSLECKVVGVPTPVLRWFKDSREIKAGDVFALTANADDPTSLGTYTCEAVNCMGRAYSSSKVHVVGRAKSDSRPPSSLAPEPPPIFTKELEDQHAKINEPLTLSCQIVVPPWPRTVVWYNKEGKVEASERYHVIEDGVGGYLLEVSAAEWPDEGEWKCVATSSGGRVGISSCYVTMDVPKNYRKPRFMENLQAVLTEEGLVSFECKVVGFPTPVLSWFKDGQELKPGDVYQLTGTNSLGSYCCIARNCMGQASSSAELTVEDIQNQLNEEEKLQLFSKNQAPKFVVGLKSIEAKIDEPFRFTVKVAIPPEPSVLWYRDDQPVDESTRSHLGKEDKGQFFLEIQNLEFLDQAEWKCVAMNDFGHSVTSCFLKLIIPRHYKKPRFLENLQAILSEEGAVNLECKVIGVPQPILKWYKDGEELKPGDIHRIISGQDGTCCLGTYTCEAQNCMGIAASSASLLGFDDSMKAKTKKAEEQALQRNLSLSTIHEERTSQMYDTPVGDITLDDKGEISFSFDGKEVSVSLYETPDLTEEEALQIVEMYADQLSENITEHNVVELPPLRFVKETSTSGNLLMEAIIIDVSPDYFVSPEEDLRTEADVEDISVLDENGPPQLSLDQDVGGEDYLEKTMALLSEEKSDIPKRMLRKKSDSQKSGDDFFSLSREQSISEEKREDDTQLQSESELQSFASARSTSKQKSKASKLSFEEGRDSSEPAKTIMIQDEVQNQAVEPEIPVVKPKRERRTSRGSRRSSSGSEKSFSKMKAEEILQTKESKLAESMEVQQTPPMSEEEFKTTMTSISIVLSKVINDIQIIERDIILKSELMSSAATASRSLEIISSLITPLSEIHCIANATKESVAESKGIVISLLNGLPQSLKTLQQSLTMVEKCIEVESESRTLVKKTCVAFVETCGKDMEQVMTEISTVSKKNYLVLDERTLSEIDLLANDMVTILKLSADTIKAKNLLSEASEMKVEEPTFEVKHLRETQKAVFELKSPVQSLLCIAENAESDKITNVAKVKSSDVILNDMSASIQDLQTALEQIESLSVKEVTSTVHKYNTQIIETVMEAAIRLRGSFEKLSIETSKEEDKEVLKQTLVSIKQNLSEISTHIDTIERNVGPLDILQSDNKLEVLQKMAQILIALENNIPRLEPLPEIKTHFDTFHKNLTKVLENVIESNEATKYFSLMKICDAVNRVNTSIKTIEADTLLSLASLGNTLRIIQDHFISNIFESDLNCSILSNIAEVLVGIQEAINQAEEISIHIDSEHVQDLSSKEFEVAKAKVIVEHIEQTIAAITKVKSLETSQELTLALQPVLENICPILEELKRYVSVTKSVGVEQEEHVTEMSKLSMDETLAAPLCELNHNIIVLNQMIMENIESIKENNEVISTIAEPLHDLNITLEILQQDVISQYGEDLTPYEVSVNIASAVQNLQSCIVMIQEQPGIEGVDEMSTLEDVSGIKTTAETIAEELLAVPIAEETAVEQGVESFQENIPETATAQALNKLNQHITVLQNPEILEALDTLSEVSDYFSLKSVALGLGELHAGIEEILHPVVIESSTELTNFINTSKLMSIAEPMQELQQCLSVLDINNIPIYEHILETSAGKIHSVVESITQFKEHLAKCLEVVYPALETADKTIEISNKVETLREACEHMKEMIKTTKVHSTDIAEQTYTLISLESTVDGLLDATDVSKGIKLDNVKYLSQELYEQILTVQENMIQFTPLSPDRLAQEAKIIQTLSDVEQNIAVLEQFNFVDLSRASDLTSCLSPQLALELESDSLLQIDDVVENAVNILQDASEETPLADQIIVEDFFKSCKSEFTILRCLVTKQMSHKKLIRVLQEFISLQTSICDFKVKSIQLNLSQDIRNSLGTFMIHANDCLNNVQDSLLKIIDTQSEVLFITPMSKINNTLNDLKLKTSIETSSAEKEMTVKLVSVFETVQSTLRNMETLMAEEVKNPSEIRPRIEEKILTDQMEELEIFLEKQITAAIYTSRTKQVLKELLNCIQTHQDYKDAIGTGKSLIAIKCLAECSDILQEKLLEKPVTESLPREIEVKEAVLKALLTEMLQPLHTFQSQLNEVQEQILTGIEEESVSIDITTTESFVQTMAGIHKEIAQIEEQITSEGSQVGNENVSLIMEIDKEIHTIQDSLKNMDAPFAEKVKEITTPINEIECTLHSILASEAVFVERKDALITEQTPKLLQHIEKYISEDIIEIVEEITAIIKIDELKQSLTLARKLQENIFTVNTALEYETTEVISGHLTAQAELVHQLFNALSVVQVQALQSADELLQTIDTEALNKVTNAITELQADLSIAISATPVTLSPKELVSEVLQVEDVIAQEEKSIVKVTIGEKSFDSDNTVIEKIVMESATPVTQIAATVEVAEAKEMVNVSVFDEKGTDAVKIAEVSEMTEPVIVEQVSIDDWSEKKQAAIISEVEEQKTTADQLTVNLARHIEEFTSKEVTETVEELSVAINTEELKQTVAIARELREKIEACKVASVTEVTGEIAEELQVARVDLTQQLRSALTVLQDCVVNTTQELQPPISIEALQRVSEAVEHLKDDLADVAYTALEIKILPQPKEDDTSLESGGENTMKRLENLLQEVNEKIDQSASEKNAESTESLRDSLDEVQTVIIKLRRDYDGAENDALNETLEDLECSVRSVQLQINENSPPELLKEACATLQLLVNNMSDTQEVRVSETIELTKDTNKGDEMLEKCSDETQETVDLLDVALKMEMKDNSSKIGNIISSLNSLRETMKSLRLSFLGNAESLIEKGIEVNQNLEQIEDKVYSLERELNEETQLSVDIRDSILTAIHSVFGSISNMRGTIMSIQKQYMYNNFGKPSENILKSVKNLSVISKNEDDANIQRKTKSLSNSLRKMLIHFEDIKFYVNLDKTARIPSDSDLTKCVLEEIKHHISEAILPNTKYFDSSTVETIDNLIQCIETNLLNIESRSTLEVKEKIPIFKNIATHILHMTESIKLQFESRKTEKFILKEKEHLEETVEKLEVEPKAIESESVERIKTANESIEAEITQGITSDIQIEQNEKKIDNKDHILDENKTSEIKMEKDMPIEKYQEPEPVIKKEIISATSEVQLHSTIAEASQETLNTDDSENLIEKDDELKYLEKASIEIVEELLKVADITIQEANAQVTDLTSDEVNQYVEESSTLLQEASIAEDKEVVLEDKTKEQPSTSKQAISELKQQQKNQKQEMAESQLESKLSEITDIKLEDVQKATTDIELKQKESQDETENKEIERLQLEKRKKAEDKKKMLKEELGLWKEEDLLQTKIKEQQQKAEQKEDILPSGYDKSNVRKSEQLKQDDKIRQSEEKEESVEKKFREKDDKEAEVMLEESVLTQKQTSGAETLELKQAKQIKDRQNEEPQVQTEMEKDEEIEGKTKKQKEDLERTDQKLAKNKKELRTEDEELIIKELSLRKESEKDKITQEVDVNENITQEEQGMILEPKLIELTEGITELDNLQAKEDNVSEERQEERNALEKEEELRIQNDKEYAEKMKIEREDKQKCILKEIAQEEEKKHKVKRKKGPEVHESLQELRETQEVVDMHTKEEVIREKETAETLLEKEVEETQSEEEDEIKKDVEVKSEIRELEMKVKAQQEAEYISLLKEMFLQADEETLLKKGTEDSENVTEEKLQKQEDKEVNMEEIEREDEYKLQQKKEKPLETEKQDIDSKNLERKTKLEKEKLAKEPGVRKEQEDTKKIEEIEEKSMHKNLSIKKEKKDAHIQNEKKEGQQSEQEKILLEKSPSKDEKDKAEQLWDRKADNIEEKLLIKEETVGAAKLKEEDACLQEGNTKQLQQMEAKISKEKDKKLEEQAADAAKVKEAEKNNQKIQEKRVNEEETSRKGQDAVELLQNKEVGNAEQESERKKMEVLRLKKGTEVEEANNTETEARLQHGKVEAEKEAKNVKREKLEEELRLQKEKEETEDAKIKYEEEKSQEIKNNWQNEEQSNLQQEKEKNAELQNQEAESTKQEAERQKMEKELQLKKEKESEMAKRKEEALLQQEKYNTEQLQKQEAEPRKQEAEKKEMEEKKEMDEKLRQQKEEVEKLKEQELKEKKMKEEEEISIQRKKGKEANRKKIDEELQHKNEKELEAAKTEEEARLLQEKSKEEQSQKQQIGDVTQQLQKQEAENAKTEAETKKVKEELQQKKEKELQAAKTKEEARLLEEKDKAEELKKKQLEDATEQLQKKEAENTEKVAERKKKEEELQQQTEKELEAAKTTEEARLLQEQDKEQQSKKQQVGDVTEQLLLQDAGNKKKEAARKKIEEELQQKKEKELEAAKTIEEARLLKIAEKKKIEEEWQQKNEKELEAAKTKEEARLLQEKGKAEQSQKQQLEDAAETLQKQEAERKKMLEESQQKKEKELEAATTKEGACLLEEREKEEELKKKQLEDVTEELQKQEAENAKQVAERKKMEEEFQQQKEKQLETAKSKEEARLLQEKDKAEQLQMKLLEDATKQLQTQEAENPKKEAEKKKEEAGLLQEQSQKQQLDDATEQLQLKEAERKKIKEELRLQKEKDEAAKKKEESRLIEEKDKTEQLQKRQLEDVAEKLQKQEAENEKKEAKRKEMEEELQQKKEKELGDAKNKEEARLLEEKEKAVQLKKKQLQDAKEQLQKQETENAKQVAERKTMEVELQQQKEKARLLQEKNEAEQLQKEQLEDAAKKFQKQEEENAKREAEIKKMEEELQEKKEKELEAAKTKDEARLSEEKIKAEQLRKQQLEDAADKLQKQEAENANKEAERKKMEEGLQQKKEKELEAAKNKEEARRLQEKNKADEFQNQQLEDTADTLQKQEAENSKNEAERKKMEEEMRLQKEKEEAGKTKEEEARILEAKAEAAQLQKRKEEEAKKEAEEKSMKKKDKEQAEKTKLKDKQKKNKEKENIRKEEEARLEKESQENARLQKEKEEAQNIAKEKEEKEEQVAEKKQKDDDVRLQKQKELKERLEQQRVEEEARIKSEKAKLEEKERLRQELEKVERCKKEQEATEKVRVEEENRLKENRIKQETEKQKKKEASENKRKEEEKTELNKQKKDEEKRLKEKRLKKEKEEQEQKEEQELIERKRYEREKLKLAQQRKDEEKRITEEKEASSRKDKDTKKKQEVAERKQLEEKQEKERKDKEKEEKNRKLEEKLQKEKRKEEELRTRQEKERDEIKRVEKDSLRGKNKHKESSEIRASAEERLYPQEDRIEEQRLQKYTEESSYNEKRRLRSKTEEHRTKTFLEHKDEPSSLELSHREDKERPTFVDHNHRDYTMEFARPSGYRERTTDINVLYIDGGAHDRNGPSVYRASTLVQQAQLRSSLPPPAITRTVDTRVTDALERRAEARHRTKAVSEARTILSEKRSTTRDSRRKPVFSTFLTDRTAVEGSRVKLTCSVLSATDPKISWFRNGQPLDNRMKYKTKFMDGLITLEVLNAVPSDSAEYSCMAENENGAITTSANLKVYPSFEASPIPPTFTRSIRDNYHLAENELVLECRIRGQPLPTITWLKDDTPVASNDRFQAFYLADGVCRLAISSPMPGDSGKYTCKAENSLWSDQITHVVNFTGRDTRLSPNIATVERARFTRPSFESRRPHFSNVLTDHTVPHGGTIGLQVEIKGAPTRVEWLREGRSVLESYRNAKTFVEQSVYTLALTDVTERESGTYTCRAFGSHGTVDMNAAITVVQHGDLDRKPATIVGRPEKDVLISVGEDLNISFRVQGDPKPKVVFMKGTRDITSSQRVCKMTSDDYVKFTLKRSVVSDAGTYCILARNAYGVDRAFVTVVVRQHASSENLISDWTYPDDSNFSVTNRSYKAVPERIPGEPSVVDGGANWLSLAWPKPEPQGGAPVLAYKVESWQVGKEGGARWAELGITPLTSYDVFNLKPGEEYHFRVTPRNRYGWGETVQTSKPIGIGSSGDRPEFTEILPGQLKVLIGQKAVLTCVVKGKPHPEIVWLKNGHEVEEESGRVSSLCDGQICSLTIDGITVDDEARYSCEATNEHGRASTYARLAVVTDRVVWEADAKLKRERSNSAGDGEYPPQFTMRLRDRRVQATYPVRLTCQVVGSPPPTVTWFKDGVQITEDARHSKSQDEHFHTLEIAPTSLEDGGVYEAMSRNSRGAVSCRCSLVVDKGIRAYVAPEFCLGLDPIYRLTDGEELRISAVVEAYPSVGVTWYRDGVRLRPSRRAIMTLDRDGVVELALAAVTTRDAGVYTCTASNEVGRASTSGKVEVIEVDQPVERRRVPMLRSPDVPYSKEPMFIRKPRSSEASEGDTVIIECEVVGDPKPDVYWLRDFLKPDYYRDATHFKRVGDGPEYRFEIPHAKFDYTGAYSVVAKNVHGEAKAVISLQILARDPDSSSDTHNVRYGRVDIIPRFQRELTDLLCCDGDAIEFECQLAGEPEPDIKWFRYGELIRECEDFSMSYDGSTARLKIKQVTAEDEGMYACEASNNLGKATSTACLVVYAPGEPNTLSQQLRRPPALLSAQSTPRSTPRCTPARSVSLTPGPEPRRQIYSPSRQVAPKFYTYPHNKVVEEGATAIFQCAVTGHPSPWATWDKDGVIITPSARITIREKDDLRLVEIEEVTVEDAGLYRITLENDYGRVEAVARLDVISHRGKFCSGVRAYSASPRRTTAYRKHFPGTSTRTDTTYMTDYRYAASGTHKFSNYSDVTLDEYVKLQSFFNKIPEVEDNINMFSEMEEDEHDERVPRVKMPDEVTAQKGCSIKLKACVDGLPNLKVMWLKDDEEINVNEAKWDRFNVEVQSGYTILEISSVFDDDEGLYTVNASNDFGIAVCDARLTIDDALERYGDRNDVILKDDDAVAVTITCESQSELVEMLKKIEMGQLLEDVLPKKYATGKEFSFQKAADHFVEIFSDSSRLLWQIKINKRSRA